jgi:hypothetical protein
VLAPAKQKIHRIKGGASSICYGRLDDILIRESVMRIKTVLLAFMQVILLLLLPAQAFSQQSLVMDPERFERQHFMGICKQASFDSGFATPRDFNNDGIMDMIIDEGKITCDGESRYLCNDEGCPSNFYVQVKEGGYVLIATARIYGYDYVMRFGNMVFVLKMPARYCDRSDTEPCKMTVRVRGTRFVTIRKE